jgi:hypothetical protein
VQLISTLSVTVYSRMSQTLEKMSLLEGENALLSTSQLIEKFSDPNNDVNQWTSSLNSIILRVDKSFETLICLPFFSIILMIEHSCFVF